MVKNLTPKVRVDIEKQLKTCFKFTKDTRRADDTPFTTIAHRDLWINNIMIKKSMNKKKRQTNPLTISIVIVIIFAFLDDTEVEAKIYDFQLYFYQTFVCDLILFLFTSVCCADLAKKFETFIHVYHTEFTKTMKLVNCPLDDYSYDK